MSDLLLVIRYFPELESNIIVPRRIDEAKSRDYNITIAGIEINPLVVGRFMERFQIRVGLVSSAGGQKIQLFRLFKDSENLSAQKHFSESFSRRFGSSENLEKNGFGLLLSAIAYSTNPPSPFFGAQQRIYVGISDTDKRVAELAGFAYRDAAAFFAEDEYEDE